MVSYFINARAMFSSLSLCSMSKPLNRVGDPLELLHFDAQLLAVSTEQIRTSMSWRQDSETIKIRLLRDIVDSISISLRAVVNGIAFDLRLV